MEYDLVISGTIGSWWNGCSADYVRYKLAQKKGKDVHVGFCSLGGYVKDGLEINQAFKDHGKVHAHAFGMNASISTIAMLGCATIDIVKGSFFLIHNTSIVIDTYEQKNKEELDAYIKKMIDQKASLATFDDVLAQMYADKTGKTKEECAAQMTKGSWLNAQQAVDFGLVDEIRDEPVAEKAAAEFTSQFMNNYNNNMKEQGIPPLPKQEQPSIAAIVDSKGKPTRSFLEMTFEGVKNLFHKNNVDKNKKDMSKNTFSVLAALLAVNAINADDNGKYVFDEDQVKKIEDRLAKLEKDNKDSLEAINAATPAIKKMKDELTKAQSDLAAKDEQIKNLQGAPGGKTGDNANNTGEAAFTAKDLYDLVKDV